MLIFICVTVKKNEENNVNPILGLNFYISLHSINNSTNSSKSLNLPNSHHSLEKLKKFTAEQTFIYLNFCAQLINCAVNSLTREKRLNEVVKY